MTRAPVIVASVGLVAVLGLAAWACSRGAKDALPPASPASAASVASESPDADAAPFRVEVAPPETCVAGTECAVSLRLFTVAGYHVNAEYPHRFVISPTLGDVAYTQPAAKLELTSEREGVLRVRFRKATPGVASIAGTFKVAVCSKETCVIEDAPVAVGVRVAAAAP